MMRFLLVLAGWIVVLAGQALAVEAGWSALRPLDASSVGSRPVSLTEYVDVLEDPTGQLTLAELRQPDHAARFKGGFPAAEALNFGRSKSAYWFRIRLTNPGPESVDRIIESFYARFVSIQFHEALPDGRFRLIDTGCVLPMSSRAYENRYFVFPLTVPAGSDTLHYLRVQSSAVQVPLRLWTPQAFQKHERRDYMVQAIYFGMVLAMALFNLLLFVALRDLSYLLYVLCVATSALAFAAANGIAQEMLWPDAGLWSDLSVNVGYSVALASFLMFMRRMLSTSVFAPRIDRWLLAQALLFLLIVAVSFALPTLLSLDHRILIGPSTVLFVFTALFSIGVGIYCAIRRQRSAYFFLAAYVSLLFGIVLTVAKDYGLAPSTVFTNNSMQIGSAIEMILLAFALADRFNEIRRERARAQKQALEAQQQLVDTLRESERELETRVEQRTAELKSSNATLAATLDDLKATQTQLIQSEKMASLGQLVANVAHEINTPIGAVKSSGRTIADALDQALDSLPVLYQMLDTDDRARFTRLIRQSRGQSQALSSREERALIRQVMQILEAAGLTDARYRAEILVHLRAQDAIADALPLLRHAQSRLVLETAQAVSAIINGTTNINTAVDRVSKIIFALKSFSRIDAQGDMTEADLRDGLETVLTIYQNQIRQGVELVCRFEEIPPLRCLPDELNQVWTNLIHNALQAMDNKGTLTISMHRDGNHAVVSVADTGCGIPDEIRARIFEPFFTTKPPGEGSGLGLDIVRKIVDKHSGRIEIQSAVGSGTTFSVFLPYDR